jgi:hypothetical protein
MNYFETKISPKTNQTKLESVKITDLANNKELQDTVFEPIFIKGVPGNYGCSGYKRLTAQECTGRKIIKSYPSNEPNQYPGVYMTIALPK